MHSDVEFDVIAVVFNCLVDLEYDVGDDVAFWHDVDLMLRSMFMLMLISLVLLYMVLLMLILTLTLMLLLL